MLYQVSILSSPNSINRLRLEMEDKIRRTEIREQSDGSDDSASEFPKDTSPSPAPTKPSRYTDLNMRPSKYDKIRESEPEEPLFKFDEEDPMETVKKILKKYRNKEGAFFEIF